MLSFKELEELKNSIIQENLLQKQGKSSLVLEKVKVKKPDLFKKDDLKIIEEPICPNIDLNKSPKEQKKEIDRVFFILIYAISEIFEKERSLKRAVLKLKTNPLAFSVDSKNHQKALKIIAKGIKKEGEWQKYLKNSWSVFVGGIKEYYLLIEDATK
jgi:hypothetical protein